jgi:rhodanese-related sulfurtransferase
LPIVIIAEDEDHVRETRIRLARIGLENVAGYLAGGVRAWEEEKRPISRTEQIDVDELHARLQGPGAPVVLDVRRPAEWQSGHIPQAVHLPLHRLAEGAGTLSRERVIAVICAGGYRSSIAASMLERQRFARITNVIGGMAAWNLAKFETTA